MGCLGKSVKMDEAGRFVGKAWSGASERVGMTRIVEMEREGASWSGESVRSGKAGLSKGTG